MSNCPLAPSTKENGTSSTTRETVEASRSGPMVPGTMVTGRMEWPMDKEGWCMLWEMFTSVNGMKIRHKDMVSIRRSRQVSMKEIGSTTNKTVMGKRLGQMEVAIKDNIKTA